ncbi:hypothetical protein GEMRC1_013708 [Eukaryota sp. GEM-RC1]
MSECFKFGYGVQKNVKESIRLLYSVELQNPAAMNSLGALFEQGVHVEKDISLAVEYYKMAVRHGNRHAKDNLGYLYYKGIGVEIDYRKAYRLFHSTALASSETGIKYVIHFLKNGIGTDKNLDLSRHFERRLGFLNDGESDDSLRRRYLNTTVCADECLRKMIA